MKKDILLQLLPPEIWLMIYKIEHNQIYKDVVEEIREKVLIIKVDCNTSTFIVCKGDNYFSPLSSIAVF